MPSRIARPALTRSELVGIVLVVLAAVWLGTGGFLAKAAFATGMTPLPVLFWRFTAAAITCWAFALGTARGRRSLGAIERRDTGAFLLLGTIYVGNGWAYVAALSLIPVSLVAMVVYLHPVFVAVLAALLGTGLRGSRAWIALAVAMAGLLLSVGGIPAGVDANPLGIGLAILCPAIYAVWIVIAARVLGDRRGGGRSGGTTADAGTASAIILSATAVTFAIVATVSGDSIAPSAVPSDAWVYLAAFGACSGLALQAFYAGVRRIGGARAAIVSAIEQVYAVGVAMILFGEPVSPVQLVGCALVIGGIILAETGNARTTTEGG